MNPAFQIRSGQREFERGIDKHRITGFLTRRQYGKTTEASRIALKKMLRIPGHDVVFGSVKLDLGREIVRKESAAMQKAFAVLAAQAKEANTLLQLAANGKEINEQLNPDDFAELYEACRLEFRLKHSNTVYSRTKVVALTPDAVGETGDLILDEVGRVKKFREVWEAVKPIISSNPNFRCLLTTTPPPDDTHYSFELLAPPLNANFKVNPNGNWYRSDLGVWVLRVDAWDAAADNVPLYDDDNGSPITPDQSRQRDPDKDAWDRNYGVKFVIGGSSAIGLLELDTAQRRGVGQCQFFQISDDLDFDNAIAWLKKNLGENKVGIGVDWASSQKEGTNPTSVTVAEQDGLDIIQRAVLIWKTNNPDIQRDRLKQIVLAIRARPVGGSARRLCQDATGQQLFCKDVQKHLSGLIPVENVIMSETVELPGYDTSVTKKTWLGDLYVSQFADNRITAPPERYYREDHRMPKKIKGYYVCEPASDGKHGDTFDSGKLASHALNSKNGAIATMEGVTLGQTINNRPLFRPRSHTRS
jgi:hypothetical protein